MKRNLLFGDALKIEKSLRIMISSINNKYGNIKYGIDSYCPRTFNFFFFKIFTFRINYKLEDFFGNSLVLILIKNNYSYEKILEKIRDGIEEDLFFLKKKEVKEKSFSKDLMAHANYLNASRKPVTEN